MFLFKASRYLEELKTLNPEIYNACESSLEKSSSDLDFTRVDKDAFSACPDDSIDYAVMEKTKDAVVIPLSCGWSDVGSWSALWDVSEKDQLGNAFNGDVINNIGSSPDAIAFIAANAMAGAVFLPTGSKIISWLGVLFNRSCSATENRCSSLQITIGFEVSI